MKKWIKKYREIIDYFFWGILATAVSWGSFAVFSVALKLILADAVLWTVSLANIFSWIFTVLFAFVTNKLWVFRSKSWEKSVALPEFFKFVSARMITGVVELVAVPSFVKLGLNQTIFGIEGMIAKVIVSVAVVLLNYVASKLFIFRK